MLIQKKKKKKINPKQNKTKWQIIYLVKMNLIMVQNLNKLGILKIHQILLKKQKLFQIFKIIK